MKSLEPAFYFNYFLIAALALGLIALMCLGAIFYHRYVSFRMRKKLKKRFDHAREGEKSAETLLKEAGYLIEKTQKTSKLPMWINGKQFSYIVRPDAFATKEGRRYLVEIKTGKVANDPKHSATRRQLLEYFHGFSVDGVLLVDAEGGLIHNVYFHKQKESHQTFIYQSSKLKIFTAFLLGALLAILAVYVALRRSV